MAKGRWEDSQSPTPSVWCALMLSQYVLLCDAGTCACVTCNATPVLKSLRGKKA